MNHNPQLFDTPAHHLPPGWPLPPFWSQNTFASIFKRAWEIHTLAHEDDDRYNPHVMNCIDFCGPQLKNTQPYCDCYERAYIALGGHTWVPEKLKAAEIKYIKENFNAVDMAGLV